MLNINLNLLKFAQVIGFTSMLNYSMLLTTSKIYRINDSGPLLGHHVARSITGDLVLHCQRISIIPKLQHPCAHL